jgi:hypothetical protein
VGVRVVRTLVAGLLLGLVPALTACSSSPVGAVSGIAAPCAGAVSRSSYGAAATRVVLQASNGTVASDIVHGRSSFHLAVPPGHYLLASDAMREAGAPAQPITVRAKETVKADLIPSCK